MLNLQIDRDVAIDDEFFACDEKIADLESEIANIEYNADTAVWDYHDDLVARYNTDHPDSPIDFL